MYFSFIALWIWLEGSGGEAGTQQRVGRTVGSSSYKKILLLIF